jgi:hypothetical protein
MIKICLKIYICLIIWYGGSSSFHRPPMIDDASWPPRTDLDLHQSACDLVLIGRARLIKGYTISVRIGSSVRVHFWRCRFAHSGRCTLDYWSLTAAGKISHACISSFKNVSISDKNSTSVKIVMTGGGLRGCTASQQHGRDDS